MCMTLFGKTILRAKKNLEIVHVSSISPTTIIFKYFPLRGRAQMLLAWTENLFNDSLVSRPLTEEWNWPRHFTANCTKCFHVEPDCRQSHSRERKVKNWVSEYWIYWEPNVSWNSRMAVGGISLHASLGIDFYCKVTPFISFLTAYCGR